MGRLAKQRYNYSMRILSGLFQCVLVLMLLSATALPVQADGDHYEATRLLKSGDILSLEVILKTIRLRYPGRILEVEIEKKEGVMVYELEIVGDDGVVHELDVDAKTGVILNSKRDH